MCSIRILYYIPTGYLPHILPYIYYVNKFVFEIVILILAITYIGIENYNVLLIQTNFSHIKFII